jgi:hypothetical protein
MEELSIKWDEVLIRSSAMGYLFVEPQAKADKEAGELSKTAKSYLINEYIRIKYGREKDILTPAMSKGIDAEEMAIKMLSRYTKKELIKNQSRISNQYITGLPDVFDGETLNGCDFLWDIKTSWSLWTFLANVPDKLDPLYYYQLQSYMWLTGCKQAAIAYVLADAPQNLIEAEKKKLMYQMNVATEFNPEYVEAAAGIELNMIYPDIELSEKILIFPVERDEEVIEKMKAKVTKAREFLSEFEHKHLNFNQLKAGEYLITV